MNSALYTGTVYHQRNFPKSHKFKYKLFMLLLDLDELNTIFDRYWLWSTNAPSFAYFCRKDHLGGPNIELKQAVYDLVKNRINLELNGPVRLLTQFRYLGYGFSPVNFYYCYDRQDKKILAIVAEINNTPWGEQYCYVIDTQQDEWEEKFKEFSFKKMFHISPFMAMNYEYVWQFNQPGSELLINMKNIQDNHHHFTASLNLNKQEINHSNMAKVLVKFPLMTIKIIFAIYWEALRLKMKGTPFYSHPHNLIEHSKEK